MNLGKLYKRLRRDLTANPQKAAILGVMLLVAGYFWAPLVMGALPARKGAKTVAAAADVILTDDPLDTTQPTRGSRKAFRWERARQAIAADAAMTPATFDRAWRDPFLSFAEAPAAPPEEPEPLSPNSVAAEPAPPLDVSPADAGLVLQGVLVGRVRSVATISGEVYREGDRVPSAVAAGAAQFTIVQISKRGVELQAGGKQHWLEFSKSKLAPGDEIVRRGKSD